MTKQKKLRYLEYYDLQNAFDLLYEDSKNNKTFNQLMHIIVSEENIKLAYRNIKRNGGSHTSGVDNETIKEIEKITADEYVRQIQNKLAWYKPKAVRRVEIPKATGKIRPLGIPTIKDRIVQQCILQVLEPICEAKFHERSNGFRPNRSAENAMAQCYRMVQKQHLHYVVDIDIKGFFDNVNHSKLIRQLWALGIRDKKLICIIKSMLKAPIIMPNGEKIYPTKGTPQGGILSPLLSNVVLNELDWWVTSQWEEFQTKTKYVTGNKERRNRGNIYRVLKKTKLKEMYIVRYADDFKIFCRNKKDAQKIFHAVRLWLKDRLSLEISEEKSKIVNLKNSYSEFLGFKIKAVKKKGKFVVKSRMSDKARKNATKNLKERIKLLQRPKNLLDEKYKLNLYNSTVWGIHNYYCHATHISTDCNEINYHLISTMKTRLGTRLRKCGIIENEYIKKRYGASQSVRFLNKFPFCPISYIQTKPPLYKPNVVCKYKIEGREKIHENLKDDTSVLFMLMREKHTNRSIEYMDNRLSLWSAQNGKCSVTKKVLWFDEIHCHHKKPISQGGTDNYKNLVIIHKDVHRLIHATMLETISKYLEIIKPTNTMLKKINKFRKEVGNEPI